MPGGAHRGRGDPSGEPLSGQHVWGPPRCRQTCAGVSPVMGLLGGVSPGQQGQDLGGLWLCVWGLLTLSAAPQQAPGAFTADRLKRDVPTYQPPRSSGGFCTHVAGQRPRGEAMSWGQGPWAQVPGRGVGLCGPPCLRLGRRSWWPALRAVAGALWAGCLCCTGHGASWVWGAHHVAEGRLSAGVLAWARPAPPARGARSGSWRRLRPLSLGAVCVQPHLGTCQCASRAPRLRGTAVRALTRAWGPLFWTPREHPGWRTPLGSADRRRIAASCSVTAATPVGASHCRGGPRGRRRGLAPRLRNPVLPRAVGVVSRAVAPPVGLCPRRHPSRAQNGAAPVFLSPEKPGGSSPPSPWG